MSDHILKMVAAVRFPEEMFSEDPCFGKMGKDLQTHNNYIQS